jgi:hypothetical protein
MNAQIRKLLDERPSYMVAEWALPALINGDYTGIIPIGAPDESCDGAVMVAQFDVDVVQGRAIIVDEDEDGSITHVFCKDEITGTFAECVRIWLA